METRAQLPFADGEYEFWLPMARVVAFERESDVSIFELYDHLGQHLAALGEELVLAGPCKARLNHVHSLIRNALLGAETSETEARKLVEVYCFPARPAIADLALAWNILRAAIYGIQLPVGSKKNESNDPKSSKKASSSSTAATSE